MSDWWSNAIWSITPTAIAAVFFAVLLRVILRADRNERKEYKRIEAEERAKAGLPPKL